MLSAEIPAGLEAESLLLSRRDLETVWPEVVQAVDRVVEGADVRQILEALIGQFPDDWRDAIILLFRHRIDALNREYARQKQSGNAARGSCWRTSGSTSPARC